METRRRGGQTGPGHEGLPPDGENGGKYPFTAVFIPPRRLSIRHPAVNRTG
jgi:hypothetical protein